MNIELLTLVVLGLVLAAYTVHLVRVVREREAPGPATDPAADAEPLWVDIGISSWPPRSL
ncbi:hypothetical protein GCM10023169_31130 [Georgenia halophila]|uniref:Uncharacterized protein n=1 Tax=Georgenia halophila TaxID=620889 RepID=A0ABP8LGD2_9MICO